MPKRVLDFDAMWASDKLASCAEWAQAEYAWLYGLADASGSFELTNLRVIWGRVAAIRRNLTIERLEQIFEEFMARGLLFTWEESGKRYGHWTGSDVPGRLPPPSWRARLEKLAPPVPQKQLAAYVARFSRGTKQNAIRDESAQPAEQANLWPRDASPSSLQPLKQGLEPTQAQGLDLEWERNREREESAAAKRSPAQHTQAASHENTQPQFSFPVEKTAEKSADQPRNSAWPQAAYTRRDEREIRVAREIAVGTGPVLSPQSAVRVKPAALERARRAAAGG
ncbi:MAG: hypothetical protein ACLP1Y_06825 [Candidatus Acidiferrales bacterium]